MEPLGHDVKGMEYRARNFLDRNDWNVLPPEEFLGRRFDEGLAWVWFPPGSGGLGASPALQPVVDDLMARAGAPNPFTRNPIGWGMGAPNIVSHGSDSEGPLPAPTLHCRGDLVPALQRAGSRLGRGVPLGERVLGLPVDGRAEKDRPWNQSVR